MSFLKFRDEIQTVGMQAQIYIGLWAMSKEARWSENRLTVRKE